MLSSMGSRKPDTSLIVYRICSHHFYIANECSRKLDNANVKGSNVSFLKCKLHFFSDINNLKALQNQCHSEAIEECVT